MAEVMITSSFLIVVLVLLRRIWRTKISRRLQYALWLLVAVRLLVPVPLFYNSLNVMNAVRYMVDKGEASGQNPDGRIVYHGKPSDKQAENGQDNRRLAEEAMILSEGTDILAEKHGTPENRDGLAVMEAAVQEDGNRLDLKELKRTLEGGSWINRFFLRGYGRYTWYLGMAVLGIWMTGCNLIFRQRIYRNRILLGREGRLKVYRAEEIDSPCLLGILRPAVYLTPEAADNPVYKKYAVWHELTHYRHGDHIWTFVRSLCLVIYWFDPLVWLAVYLSARDCETACDEGVTCGLGEELSREYGSILIEMSYTSSGKSGIMRCATEFSARKSELKERISKIAEGRKRTGILVAGVVAACGTGLAACTFGGAAQETAKGGYVEENVELPVEFNGAAIACDGSTVRIFDAYGSDLLSMDGGNVFGTAEPVPNAQNLKDALILGMAGNIDGARICNVVTTGEPVWELVTGENHKILLESPDGKDGSCPVSVYGEGCFYSFSGTRIYRTDAVTGKTVRFVETDFPVVSLAAGEDILYAVTMEDFQLYDLDKGERLAKQDETVRGYLGEKGLDPSESSFPVLLYPSGEEIYVLTHDGLYRHTLYENTMELVLDSGAFGSIGDPGRDFLGLAVIKGDGEGRDTFLILYSDGTLTRYTFDPELSSEPDLRIYSVYEDVNVVRAVNAYRASHPGQTVIYEVGNKSGYGVALMDILNNLSTEIAAGTGPDILVMDAIPYQSYAEKGVLMDLSFLRDTMTEETYYTNVVDGYAADDMLLAMPMAFVVPVAGTNPEWMELLEKAESLSEFADILEEAREKFPEGDLAGFWNAEHTLSQLSQASMGAWMNEEGGIDREAVAEFLTQAKRIYDVTRKGAPEGMENWYTDWELEYLDANMITRTFRQDLVRPLSMLTSVDNDYKEVPTLFYADYLRENYEVVNGYLKLYDGGLTLLPGQEYGSCLPVTVLAMNQGTKHLQESKEFMEYVFSEEAQSSMDLFGFPVNRQAYKRRQADPNPRGWGGVLRLSDASDLYTIRWPSEEAFQRLDDLLDQVTGVGICDSQVYNTVIRLGQAALKREAGIEETVDAIEREMQIYLAE